MSRDDIIGNFLSIILVFDLLPNFLTKLMLHKVFSFVIIEKWLLNCIRSPLSEKYTNITLAYVKLYV